MASKGTYAALQQLRPIDTDFGAIARQEEDRYFDEVARQKELRDEELARQAEIASDFQTDYSSLADVITNTKSIDEAFARGVGSARDQMGEIYKQIQRNPKLADDVTTQLKLQNLKNFSKTLKMVSDNYTAYAQKVTAGSQDGTMSNWNNGTLNRLDSIFRLSNLEVKVDPRTGSPIATTIKVDDNGEPMLDSNGVPIVEKMDLQGILDGRGLEEVIPVYNMAGQAQKIGKDLADKVKANPMGQFGSSEKQTFDMIEGDVRSLVKGMLGSPNNPTAVAKSIWADVLGEEQKELTEADFKKIEDAFVNSTRPFYEESIKSEIDYDARNAAIKESNRKKEEKIPYTGDFEPVTNEEGEIRREMFRARVGTPGQSAVGFSLPANKKTQKAEIEVTSKDGLDIIVDRIYLLDDGRLGYSGYENLGKESSTEEDDDYNETRVSKAIRGKAYNAILDGDDPVVTGVARAYGLKNEGELKERLEKKISDYEGGSPKLDEKKQEDLRKKYNY